ncbi:MAG: hypothetical protein MZV63_66500 [Marinilabiliales bacterium]|nr:hypothetical protein [Marinilabiliales bacterium]
MSLKLEDFEHYSPQEYLAFALYLSDSWIKRTVEKVELLSETEYLHRASFQINISNEFLSSSFEQLAVYSRYWAKTGKDKITSQAIDAFTKRITKSINDFFRDGEPKKVYLPIFKNIKDPLIELDIYREGSPIALRS